MVVLKVLGCFALLPYAAEQGWIPPVGLTFDGYFVIAKSLAAGDGFRIGSDAPPTLIRGPIYPFLLSGLIRLFGESTLVFQCSNILLGLLTACLARQLTVELCEQPRLADFVFLAAALFPPLLYLETRAAVENLFNPLLVASLLSLHIAMKSDRRRHFLLAGSLLALAALTRSSILAALPLLALALIWKGSRENNLFKGFSTAGCLVAAFIIVVSPWAVRNLKVAGIPTISESLLGVSAYHGLCVTAGLKADPRPFGGTFERSIWKILEESRAEQRDIARQGGSRFHPTPSRGELFASVEDELRYSSVLLSETVRIYKKEPTLFARHVWRNLGRFWFLGGTAKMSLVGAIFMAPLLFFAAVGMVVGFRRQPWDIVPIVLTVSALYLVHLPIFSHARYAMPLVPLLLVMASLSVNRQRPATSSAPKAA